MIRGVGRGGGISLRNPYHIPRKTNINKLFLNSGFLSGAFLFQLLKKRAQAKFKKRIYPINVGIWMILIGFGEDTLCILILNL